jgi:HSP20 family molecular chaperone IbpA
MTDPERDDSEREPDADDGTDSGIHVDVGLSVGGLLDGLLGGGSPDRAGATDESSASTRDSDAGTDPSPTADDYHVQTYRDGDELTVVCDLPDVDPDEVTAGIDERRAELVVAVGETEVDRIPLHADPVAVETSRFKNDVLRIVLRAVRDGQ